MGYVTNDYMRCVEVVARFTPEGKIIPITLIWDDSRRYDIDRILDVRRGASLKAGGLGMRYTVRIRGKETYMWYDNNENIWFMEK